MAFSDNIKLDFGDILKIGGLLFFIIQAWFRLGSVEDQVRDQQALHEEEVSALTTLLRAEISDRNRRIDNIRDRLTQEIAEEDYGEKIHDIELLLARQGFN